LSLQESCAALSAALSYDEAVQPRDRLIVALDLSDREEILTLADSLADVVGMFKVGLQAFVANGPSIVREVRKRGPVFLDLKLHDIPNTASRATTEAGSHDVALLTVHASGGVAMMQACRAATNASTRILGVTVLTSLAAADLAQIGFEGDPLRNAVRLSRLAAVAGLDGVVASPLEIEGIREACGDDLLIVVPGIRGRGEPAADQRRTMTAGEAVARGASYLVVGRPITAADDPRGAAMRVVDEIASAFRA
jgi:orotidine-5'-phosphate decarboxylase